MITERDYMKHPMPMETTQPLMARGQYKTQEWVQTGKSGNAGSALLLGIILCILFLPAGILFFFFSYRETTTYELKTVTHDSDEPTFAECILELIVGFFNILGLHLKFFCYTLPLWTFTKCRNFCLRFWNYLKTGYPTLERSI